MVKMVAYAGAAAGVVAMIYKLSLVHLFGGRRGSHNRIQHMAAAVFEMERRQGLAER